MTDALSPRMSKGQLELIYLIGNDEAPYDIYIRSAMKIERQRLVLARLQQRFGFSSVENIKSFYTTHADEIYLRLEQLGSFAIDPCGGPSGRNDHPELTEQDLWDAATILRKLSQAGAD